MLKKTSDINKQIKSFIEFAVRNVGAEDKMVILNSNISYMPTSNENKIEFKVYNLRSTGRILQFREKIDLDTDILMTNDMDMRMTIKIRVVSSPERTLDIVDRITLLTNSFMAVNALMPSINVLNEEMRLKNVEVQNGENTYYIYDIDIPCVLSERIEVKASELTGVFTDIGDIEYNII